MARYIDADDLKAVINANDWSNPVVPDVVGIIIDRTPTADVLPKSEVYELKKERDEYKKHVDEDIIYVNRIKAEVAREIFEEIEKRSSMWGGERHINYKVFAELKKKYTEGET